MTNLDIVIDLRRSGVKPSAVYLDLVGKVDRAALTMTSGGIVTCEVPSSESLADLDLRALAGLRVLVNDFAGDRRRHRKLAALVAAVDPAVLVMPIAVDDGYLIHRRWGGSNPRTESYRL